MTTPRRKLIDSSTPMFYHLVSRCVRRSWLTGFDQKTHQNYSHRKKWILDRLKQLTPAFALEVHAYAIMSNHFHLVVYYDPRAADDWEDHEVVNRWLRVCPSKRHDGSIDNAAHAFRRAEYIDDPAQIEKLRSNLSSISVFMKLLKQPIARRANKEDEITGHFFDLRFYSGALLDREAVLAAMAYVDLNPIRAKIARSLHQSKYTSIQERVELNREAKLDEYLAPLSSGLTNGKRIEITLSKYLTRLEALSNAHTGSVSTQKLEKWRNQVNTIRKRQRAHGSHESIIRWLVPRGMTLREAPLSS